MKNYSYNNFFMNFASGSKFDIIMALKDGPLSASQIAKRVNGEQSAVSHNLAKLSGCHVIDVRKEGKQRIYSLNMETVIPILQTVEKHVKKYCARRCCK